jgi:hypothetical protein
MANVVGLARFMPSAQREMSALSEGFSTVRLNFFYGPKPIAAGHQHVFQLGAGKYALRGLFQYSLGGTREGLVDAIELPRFRIRELLLAEEEMPRHRLVLVRHLDGAPGGEGSGTSNR